MRSIHLFFLGVALMILGITMMFVLKSVTRTQHYSQRGASMMPTFPPKTIVFVKHNYYADGIGKVARGDVVLFTRADDAGQPTEFLTRVIGLPGDKIEMAATDLKINGQRLSHKLVRSAAPLTIYAETNGAASYQVQYGDPAGPGADFAGVVPAGQMFCLGDNRDNSYDSRYTGSVPFAAIVGKEVAQFKPPEDKNTKGQP